MAAAKSAAVEQLEEADCKLAAQVLVNGHHGRVSEQQCKRYKCDNLEKEPQAAAVDEEATIAGCQRAIREPGGREHAHWRLRVAHTTHHKWRLHAQGIWL